MSTFFITATIVFSLFSQNDSSFEDGKAFIEKSLIDLAESWNNRDIKKHMKNFHPDILVLTKSGRLKGKDRYKKSIIHFFEGRLSYEVEYTNTEIREISEGIILVTGKYTLSRGIRDVSGWYTAIWKYLDEKWQIIYEAGT